MKEIIVLGSSGFIGNNIYNNCIKKKYITKGFSSTTCNLLKRSEIEKVFSSIKNDFSLVICSAITRTKADSINSMLNNITMISNTLSVIRNSLLKNIIFISSVDIYGTIKRPAIINEDTNQKPNGYYGLSKLICEHFFNIIIPEIPTTILRLPGIYGYGDNYNSIVGKFINNANIKKEISITNNGDELRDYVEISDLCEIIRYFISHPFNGPVNIATGQSKTIKEIAEIVIKKLNNNSVVKTRKVTNSRSDLVFDNDLIRSFLPSFKYMNINEGIEHYITNLQALN